MPTFESVGAGALVITGTTLPAPYPATVNSGDLLYLYAFRKTNATQHTFTTPADWTELTTAATDWGARHSLWYRIADGTETGDVSITTSADLSGGQSGRAFMARVSDTAGHDTGVYSLGGQAGTTEMVIATGITPSEDNCLVLTGLGITHGETLPSITPPSGYTSRLAVSSAFNGALALATRLQTTAEATGALTWDTDPVNITNAGGGFIVSALPAASGATLSLPTATSIAQTTTTIGCTSNSVTGTLYAVVTTSATPPSAAQVEAGQNNAGTAAVWSGNDTSVTAGANTFAATGLTADTTYHTYFVQDEGTAEYSNVLAGTFDTLAVAAFPVVEPMYYAGQLLSSRTNIGWKVASGHSNLIGTVLGSGATNGTTNSSGVFVFPAGTEAGFGAASTAVTLFFYWEEGDPVEDRSLIVKTTLAS